MTTSVQTSSGTVRLPSEDAVWRAVRIRKPLAEIEAAWSAAALPGTPELNEAAGDRGVDLSVTLAKDAGPQTEHLLSPYEGEHLAERLESALRAFKARMETGEVATTTGQPSGRSE